MSTPARSRSSRPSAPHPPCSTRRRRRLGLLARPARRVRRLPRRRADLSAACATPGPRQAVLVDHGLDPQSWATPRWVRCSSSLAPPTAAPLSCSSARTRPTGTPTAGCRRSRAAAGTCASAARKRRSSMAHGSPVTSSPSSLPGSGDARTAALDQIRADELQGLAVDAKTPGRRTASTREAGDVAWLRRVVELARNDGRPVDAVKPCVFGAEHENSPSVRIAAIRCRPVPRTGWCPRSWATRHVVVGERGDGPIVARRVRFRDRRGLTGCRWIPSPASRNRFGVWTIGPTTLLAERPSVPRAPRRRWRAENEERA